MKQSNKTFAKNQKGFIFPINIYVDSTYMYFDDFCVRATILKIDSSDGNIIFDSHG